MTNDREAEAVARFESGEGFDSEPGNYTPLGWRLRIDAARNLRDAAACLIADQLLDGSNPGVLLDTYRQARDQVETLRGEYDGQPTHPHGPDCCEV